MKQLKKNILFWTLIFTAVYLCIDTVTRLCGLRFRVWVREPATILIAVMAVIGVFQLLCFIPKRWVKITAIVLWLAAVIAGGCYGVVIFAFSHIEESAEIRDGKTYVIETESALWESWDYWYEARGLFFRGMNVLNEEEA